MNVDTALQTYTSLSDTELCRILASYGDRGLGYHQYSRFYSPLFEPIRNDSFSLLEVGVGASLRGWREYFPNANIVGVDIDENSLFQEDRIQTFQCDASSVESIQSALNRPELQGREFRIIIDDGSHTKESRRLFFENSIGKLETGGLYIIEDLGLDGRIYEPIEFIEIYQPQYPTYKFELISIETSTDFRPNDNHILVIQKLENL